MRLPVRSRSVGVDRKLHQACQVGFKEWIKNKDRIVASNENVSLGLVCNNKGKAPNRSAELKVDFDLVLQN